VTRAIEAEVIPALDDTGFARNNQAACQADIVIVYVGLQHGLVETPRCMSIRSVYLSDSQIEGSEGGSYLLDNSCQENVTFWLSSSYTESAIISEFSRAMDPECVFHFDLQISRRSQLVDEFGSATSRSATWSQSRAIESNFMLHSTKTTER
jgi:hypothetical protein